MDSVLVLGALPYQAMHMLARRHGPEASREVMKVHDAAFADRPVYATVDIFTYGGQNFSFVRHDIQHWKAVRKLCTVELLSPRRVRSFRPVRERGRRLRSITSNMSVMGPVVVNVRERVKVTMNDVIMRVSVGDRCVQRAVYLEDLKRGLSIMYGFNLSDLFPTSGLARAVGRRTLRAALEARERIQSIVDSMVHDHRRAIESEEATDVGGHEREDILTTLLQFQSNVSLMMAMNSYV